MKPYDIKQHVLTDERGVVYGFQVDDRRGFHVNNLRYVLDPKILLWDDAAAQCLLGDHVLLAAPFDLRLAHSTLEVAVLNRIIEKILEHDRCHYGRWQHFASMRQFDSAVERRAGFARRFFYANYREVLARADVGALKVARRFHWSQRGGMYLLSIVSPRVRQFIQVFPVGAMALLSKCTTASPYATWYDVAGGALRAIDRGVKLRDVAAMIGVSPVWRCIVPSVMSPSFIWHFRLGNEARYTVPSSTLEQRHWSRVGRYVAAHLDPTEEHHKNILVWALRHYQEFAADHINAAVFCQWAVLPPDHPRLLGVPSFNDRMSFGRAAAYVSNWVDVTIHTCWRERRMTMLNESETPVTLEPWLPEAQVGNYHIVHLSTYRDTLEEGQRMGHCIARYFHDAMTGRYRLYSVRNEQGRSLASLGLVERGNGIELAQLVGPANSAVSPEIEQAVSTWLAQCQ